ncbi:hypothetical protein NK983_33075, partial [Salmonella enterica subsp. enterica serovar Typhimurium]|nr:hypothetical protein [Salmonella enterica subsp. enterica serovar Typhimurium]
MLELIQNLDNYKEIKGIAYRGEQGQCVTTPERPLIKDLNTLPFPARHRIDFTPYLEAWKQRHGYSMMSLSTMRGC